MEMRRLLLLSPGGLFGRSLLERAGFGIVMDGLLGARMARLVG